MRVQIFCCCIMVFALLAFSPHKSDISPSGLYVQKHLTFAMEEMERYGIPVSIKLAQGILESDSGSSDLSLNSNNHFGIKCKSYWIGPVYYHPDDDYDREGRLMDSCFRVYRSVQDSYRDHSIFLRYSTHYDRLFELDPLDYRSWARHLQQIGYATNPRYAESLISIIERYELYKFDQMVASK